MAHLCFQRVQPRRRICSTSFTFSRTSFLNLLLQRSLLSRLRISPFLSCRESLRSPANTSFRIITVWRRLRATPTSPLRTFMRRPEYMVSGVGDLFANVFDLRSQSSSGVPCVLDTSLNRFAHSSCSLFRRSEDLRGGNEA